MSGTVHEPAELYFAIYNDILVKQFLNQLCLIYRINFKQYSIKSKSPSHFI